jgi:hypothetical protein
MKQFLTMIVCMVAPVSLLAGEISVQGTGSVSLAADNGYINMSVVTEAPRPADAMSLNNEATNRVFDTLTRLGIKKNEMQTQGLKLTPKYFYQEKQEPKLVGYTVIHTIQITVCKIADTGKVLDAVIKDGANQINSVSFGLSEDKRKDALNVARKQAAQNAIEKVELYTNAFGLKNKELKSVSEQQDYSRKNYAYDIATSATRTAATNVEGGEIQVSVTVSTVWEVK